MKKQAVCEYCGKTFDKKSDKEQSRKDYYNYKQDCVEHEITHLNLREKFVCNLSDALDFLDKKYGQTSNILKVEVSVCYDSYYGKDITYEFKVENSAIKENIQFKITVSYDNKEEIPTSKEIIAQLEHHFFIPKIKNKYEGEFCFEDWCGGDGANDYMIGESYMRTIYEAFKGKKVRIEVIE